MIRGMCGMAVNKDEYWRRQGTCGRRGGKNVWVSETKVPNGVYRGGNVEAKTSQTKVQKQIHVGENMLDNLLPLN